MPLAKRATRKIYSHSFRRSVVEFANSHPEMSIKQIAEKFQIRAPLVWSWKRLLGDSPDRPIIARKTVSKRGAISLINLALTELDNRRPNLEVAKAYIILARHEMVSEEREEE